MRVTKLVTGCIKHDEQSARAANGPISVVD